MKNKTKTENQTGYRDLLTQREYLKLVAANVVNRFGDSVDSIAFAWLVYAITGSAAWSAVIIGVNQLPTILLQPFTGVLGDRWRKKHLMIVADLVRALLVSGFLLLYLKNLLNPWVMVAFTISVSTVEAFRVPAGSALVPKLLERRLYDFGTGLNSSVSRVMELLGIAAGGVLIGVFGIWVVLLLDAVTYFLSALILAGIRCREEAGQRQRLDLAGYGKDLREGFSYVKTRRVVFNFCILAFLLNALLVPINAFEAALVNQIGMGAEFMSMLNLLVLVGMGGASFSYPYLRKKYRATGLVIVSGLLIGGSYLVFAGAGRMEQNLAALVCLGAALVVGGAAGILGMAVGAEFMRSVEPEYMARCSGVCSSISHAAMPLSSALCSFLAVFCSIFTIFIACGIFVMLLFICMAMAGMQFDSPEEA